MIDIRRFRKSSPSFALLPALAAAVILAAAASPAAVRGRAPGPVSVQAGQTQAVPPSPAPDLNADRLSASEKSEIFTALALKSALGDKVWPGFDSASIPIVFYNSKFEFLAGAPRPPAGWDKVAGDELAGGPYFRRAAASPQSFAVKVDPGWAGSISTPDSMNAKNPIKVSPDLHTVMILHEMFHAFEAVEAPKRFAAALDSYKAEPGYPYGDKDFADAWRAEGAALAGALKAKDDLDAIAQARKFIEIRDTRRGNVRLDVPQLEFEREVEWLEGMAEYAEIAFSKLAAGRPGSAPGTTFGAQLPWLLQWDLVRLEKQLSAEKGDLRFYVSGMAQAFLLDRLDPDWKEQAALNTLVLEDQLRRVVLEPGRNPVGRSLPRRNW